MKKPEDKAEALQMIEELKSYVEGMDKPVWCEDDIRSGQKAVSMGGSQFLIVYLPTGVRKYNLVDIRPGFVLFETVVSRGHIAAYLNENNFTKA